MKKFFNNHKLPQRWLDNLESLDFAFQPIVNIHTAEIYGVEALLRNYQDIGCKSIFSLFDKVYEENLLYAFDLELRKKAFEKFSTIKNYQDIKIFYNLDNRLLEMPDFSEGNTNKLAKHFNMEKENICFEISERHEFSGSNMQTLLDHYKENSYSIAIDDFGVGYAGYKLLYDSTPDIIKIDRFFLQSIEKNVKKKLLVKSVTQLAIQLGIKVVAEGVETKEELYVCKEMGCHLVQGYLIQKPTQNSEEILPLYPELRELIKSDKRQKTKTSKLKHYIEKIEPLEAKNKMSRVVDYFKESKHIQLLPIVNSANEPVGIIKEDEIKEFLYSPYGISLLLNEEAGKSKIKNFLRPCGVADLSSDIHSIIELFASNAESLGIIITKNSKYYGFLSSRSIISVMNEENLLLARDQNPLTKLPGNSMIERHFAEVVADESGYLLCYFDLDNFKAYNDTYGFRNGDRIIQLFAQLMRKHLPEESFKAHIGGDDFFVSFKEHEDHLCAQNIDSLKYLIKTFSLSVKEFYSLDDRKRGYIVSKDRDNMEKRFELLSVSASILKVRRETSFKNSETIHRVLSVQKKVAKRENEKIAMSALI